MRSVVPATAAVLVAALLGACSSSSSGTPTSAPTSHSSGPSSSTPQSSSSAPLTSSSAPAASGGLTEAQATAALLTAAEVGTGFTMSKSGTEDTPLPCAQSQPPLDTRFPPAVKVESDYNASAVDAALSEEIETYADTPTVARVVAAGEQGLACGKTTEQGDTYTISKPTDITSDLGGPVDKAEAWQVSSSKANLELVIVQLGPNLVVFSFAAATNVDTSKLPDVGTVITTGIRKVAAQL